MIEDRMIEDHVFDDRATLASTLARRTAAWLRPASTTSRGASLVVPGGTTPGPMLRHLAQQELPWSKVQVSLTDERWLPNDHPDSNERLLRQNLLRDRAVATRVHGLWRPELAPSAAAIDLDETLRTLRPFDLVILGMGLDGHIASLFADDAGLPAAPRRANGCSYVAVPANDHRGDRISLTLAALLDSERVVLLITGDDKHHVYQRARAEASPLPVAVLLHSGHPRINVFWAP